MAKILDGRIVRDKIAENLKSKILNLKSKPKLVIIQVGNRPESNTYIRQKVLFGEKIGAIVDHIKLPENTSQENLISQLLSLNSQLAVHGIIVQMPIPDGLDKNEVVDAIDPVKDVDGLTSMNIKLLFQGSYPRHPRESEDRILDRVENDNKVSSRPNDLLRARTIINQGFIPATTRGILTLLDYYKISIAGKKIAVVGRSTLVGKPTALAFLNRDATVTICHSKTENLPQITRSADVLIVAAGKPKMITKDHVSKGQVVIDVGINVLPNQKLVGDVDFDSVKSVVAAISPVPGGVGPMTVVSLFENLFEAYHRQYKSA